MLQVWVLVAIFLPIVNLAVAAVLGGVNARGAIFWNLFDQCGHRMVGLLSVNVGYMSSEGVETGLHD